MSYTCSYTFPKTLANAFWCKFCCSSLLLLLLDENAPAPVCCIFGFPWRVAAAVLGGSDIYKRGSKNGMAANIGCIIQSEMPSELPCQDTNVNLTQYSTNHVKKPLKRRISSQPQKVADMRCYPPRKQKQSTQENELQLPFVREGQNSTKRDVRKPWLQTPVASCTWRCLPSCPAKIRCRSSPKAERLFVFPETLESIPNRISNKYGRIAPLSEKGVQKIAPFEACVQRRTYNGIREGVQACRKSNWTVEVKKMHCPGQRNSGEGKEIKGVHQPVMDMRDENFAGGDSGMGESGRSDSGMGESVHLQSDGSNSHWGTCAMRRRRFYSTNGFVSGNQATSNIFPKRRLVVYPHNVALTIYFRLKVLSPKTRQKDSFTSHIHFLTISIKLILFSLSKIAKLQRSLQIKNIHNIHKQL
ncbi:hypothetical protein LXL04_034194 [Taraxacum kok-saghyz]